MRWVQRILWVVFILNLLGLAGLTVLYFGGPGWLQEQLPKALEKQLGRPVQLTQVRVEPLSLKLILQGLEIREADSSETFVSLDEIGIDLSWNSFWQWAVVVEEVELISPYLNVSHLGEQRLNFSDLIEQIAAPETDRTSSVQEEAKFPFEIRTIAVRQGKLRFQDVPHVQTYNISGLNFRLPAISSFHLQPARASGPATLVAQLGETSLRIVAQEFTIVPSETVRLDVQLKNLYLPDFQQYLPKEWTLQLQDGLVDADLKLGFQAVPFKQFALSGTVQIQRLSIQNSLPGEASNRLLEISHLQVPIPKIQVLPSLQIALGQVELHEFEAWLTRTENGAFFWDQILQTTSGNRGDENPGVEQLSVELGGVRISKGKLHFIDEKSQPAKPQEWQLDQFSVGELTLPVSSRKTSLSLKLAREGGPSISFGGSFNPSTLRSQGRLDLREFELAELTPFLEGVTPVEVKGSLDLKTDFEWDPAFQFPRLKKTTLKLEDFQLDQGQETWLQLASLDLNSDELNLPAKQVSINSLFLKQPQFLLSLDEDWTTNWNELVPSLVPKNPKESDQKTEWQVQFNRFQVDSGALNLIHQRVNREEIKKLLRIPVLEMNDFSWPLAGESRTRLKLTTLEQEEFSLDGIASWGDQTWRGALKANLKLLPWETYFRDQLPWKLNSGRMNTALQLQLNWSPFRLRAEGGKLHLWDLELVEAQESLPDLKFAELSMSGAVVEWPRQWFEFESLNLHQLSLKQANSSLPDLTLGGLASGGLSLTVEDQRLNLGALQFQNLKIPGDSLKSPSLDLEQLTALGLDLSWSKHQAKLAKLDLQQFQVTPTDAIQPELWLPKAVAVEWDLDWFKKELLLESVSVDKGLIELALLPDRRFNWERWLPTLAKQDGRTESSDDTPWKVELAKLEATLDRLSWQDLETPTPPLVISNGSLQFKNLNTDRQWIENFTLQGKLDETGQGSVTGSIRFDKDLSLDVDLVDFDLLTWQPYWIEYAPLKADQALGTLQGRFYYKFDLVGEWLRFDGLARIRDARLIDKRTGQIMGQWDVLETENGLLEFDPFVLDLGSMLLADFELPIRRQTDGGLEWMTLFESEEDEEDSNLEPGPVFLKKLSLERGNLSWDDASNAKPVLITLQNLKGDIQNILGLNVPLELDLKGLWEGVAPLEAKLALDWQRDSWSINGKLYSQDFDLLWVNPYAERYLGYRFDRGSVELSVDYKTAGEEIDVENNLLIQRLVLGPETPGPDTLDLPVELAVGLLRDPQGTIDLSLPVSGNLEDPEFGLWDATLTVFVTLISKAVTAPFTLIADAIFDGDLDENTQIIRFRPGSLEIPAAEKTKLDQLRDVLKERPQLKMELVTLLRRETEIAALREQELDRQIRSEKIAELIRLNNEDSISVNMILTSDEQQNYLNQMFQRIYGSPEGLSEEEVRLKLLDKIPIEDLDLEELAEQRAYNIRNLLLEEGLLAAGQIKLNPVFETTTSRFQSSRVELRFSR
ncbi:MAG: hypothetical protein CL915_03525 [Deltaproteobacteria bacterium]|nr:hypothetical protein [Deltaproteobacteria bacterium]